MSTSFFRSSRPAGQALLVTPRHCLSAALVIVVLLVGIGALPGKALHLIAHAFLSGLRYAGLSGGLFSRAMTGMRIARAAANTNQRDVGADRPASLY